MVMLDITYQVRKAVAKHFRRAQRKIGAGTSFCGDLRTTADDLAKIIKDLQDEGHKTISLAGLMRRVDNNPGLITVETLASYVREEHIRQERQRSQRRWPSVAGEIAW